jgi:hypothetical protein
VARVRARARSRARARARARARGWTGGGEVEGVGGGIGSTPTAVAKLARQQGGFIHSSEANKKLSSVLLDTYGKEYAIVRVETSR